MEVGQQRRTIAVSSMVVFSLGFLNAAQKGKTPTARFFVGVGFTYTFISIFADMGAGDFGAGLAILIMISAILYEGEDVVGLLEKRAKPIKGEKRKRGEAPEPLEGSDALAGADSLGTSPEGVTKTTRLRRPRRRRRTRRG